MRRVDVGGLNLDVAAAGSGEPIALVQTALTADELTPLARALVDRGFRAIGYHRRGYGDSTPVHGPGSVARDADDCRRIVDALGLSRVHIVGYSYSGAVGLQLAAYAPERVRSLTLIEPPPLHVPSAGEFRAANERLLATRSVRGVSAAFEEFLSLLSGPEWRTTWERRLPGAVEQMQRDAATFFDTDLPALFSWQFGPEDARRITCPVLHVGGSASGPWFAEVRELVATWLPDAESALIEGADHSLPITHTQQVADAITEFVGRHVIPDAHPR